MIGHARQLSGYAPEKAFEEGLGRLKGWNAKGRWTMAFNIKDRETHEPARGLAEREGTSLTRAVRKALQEALRPRERKQRPTLARLDEISRHCASLPVLDDRPAEEILGCGERGLPT